MKRLQGKAFKARPFRVHPFRIHLAAFLLMILPPVPMFYAAQAGAFTFLALFLGLVILGNILVLIAG